MASGLVLCFSGSIGAGKSSITHALADLLQWPRAGFGDYLREQTRQKGGDPNSRKDLQDMGQSLVDSDPDGFCQQVLTSGGFAAGKSMLLDGIRHVDIYRRVQRLVAPSRTALFHLNLDDAESENRIAMRDGSTADLARARVHRVEAELAASLPSIADCIVDAKPDVVDIAGFVLTQLTAFGISTETVEQALRKLR